MSVPGYALLRFAALALPAVLGSGALVACRPSDPAPRFSAAMRPARPADESAGTAATRPSTRKAGEPIGAGPRPFLGSRAGRPAFGYRDGSGRVLAEPRFEHAGSFSEGRAPVQIGYRWGYVDGAGGLAVPAVFDWAGAFSEGRAAVADSGAHRFIDSAGNPIGRLRFSDAKAFSGGYAAVRFGDADDGAWGFVDREGRLAIPPIFSGVGRGFRDGLAVVEVSHEGRRRYGLIDTTGGFAADTLYDSPLEAPGVTPMLPPPAATRAGLRH